MELKAVVDLYPLVGRLELVSGAELKGNLAPEGELGRCGGADLLTKLGLNIGDRLRIGEASFVITGVIAKEPDRVATVWALVPAHGFVTVSCSY